ncbi:hypothetical protein [Vibrio barjaei]|uniref:hypothetical protein n=1 Tax=Vibrio barjaei TaxID=1676683 RepID=UPI0022850DBC|nr:hypothetical protein [Vibrio barjaei]MCY9874615.1 hypothetical protein [Vibrio barjaei]
MKTQILNNDISQKILSILTSHFGELPADQVLAGGSIASAYFEAMDYGIKPRYKDLDIFIPHDDDISPDTFITRKPSSDTRAIEFSPSLSEANFSAIPKGSYSITSSIDTGNLNYITIKVYNDKDSAHQVARMVIDSFDLNCTQIAAYKNVHGFTVLVSEEFLTFCEEKVIKPINLYTGAHTLVRLCEKSQFMGLDVDQHSVNKLIDSLHIAHIHAEAHTENGEDPYLAGWLMADPYRERAAAMIEKHNLAVRINTINIEKNGELFSLHQLQSLRPTQHLEKLVGYIHLSESYRRDELNGRLQYLLNNDPENLPVTKNDIVANLCFAYGVTLNKSWSRETVRLMEHHLEDNHALYFEIEEFIKNYKDIDIAMKAYDYLDRLTDKEQWIKDVFITSYRDDSEIGKWALLENAHREPDTYESHFINHCESLLLGHVSKARNSILSALLPDGFSVASPSETVELVKKEPKILEHLRELRTGQIVTDLDTQATLILTLYSSTKVNTKTKATIQDIGCLDDSINGTPAQKRKLIKKVIKSASLLLNNRVVAENPNEYQCDPSWEVPF